MEDKEFHKTNGGVKLATEKFREVHFNQARQDLLGRVNGVVEQYRRLGYMITLRQLYYQLVARDLFPEDRKWAWNGSKWVRSPDGTKNAPPNYKWLGEILSDARMGGHTDWNAIEDRGRVPQKHGEWTNLEDIIDSVQRSFRLPRWEHQGNYVELWSEKDALASVLQPITDHYHINLVINKGYSSTSAMYFASKRMTEMQSQGKEVSILYLGDFDPSGLDMDRDIRDRMQEFRIDGLEVRRIGLTMEQVRRLNPPPNPAKITDPRAGQYIARHGNISWEVDALPPEELDRLVRDSIEALTDMGYYNRVIAQEERLKEWLTSQIDDEDEYREEVIGQGD
jgi:hypothetical protein